MRLAFPEAKLRYFASQYKLNALEPLVIGLKQSVTEQGFLSRAQLYQVARWKAARSAEHVLKNSDSYVRETTKFALAAADERCRIEALTVLDGVLWPSASVVLHLFHHDLYPILDFRALESIGEPVPKQYDFQFWWEYVHFCRALASKHGMEMRELDRALWQYSYEKSGEA